MYILELFREKIHCILQFLYLLFFHIEVPLGKKKMNYSMGTGIKTHRHDNQNYILVGAVVIIPLN